jgi:hypothetical protein
MGSGAWSATSYHTTARARAAAGIDTFDYSARAQKSGNLVVHPSLNPYGLTTRESRDSAEHPDSNSILISLDVTGSMTNVLRQIHRDLPHLHELLLGHKYIPHPQILFAAVGDATCDRVPLQVGQFESDNRMDQNLENMVLEGGGGGQKTESYELSLYIAARHTAIDCDEKRGRKGYLFIIGDEMAYPLVQRAHVNRLLGIDPQADIPLQQITAEAQEKYHVYFIIPGGAAHGGDTQVVQFWEQLLGTDHLIKLRDPDDTSESIAMTIGLNEGVINRESAQQQMAKRGKMPGAIDRILSAIGMKSADAPLFNDATGSRRL